MDRIEARKLLLTEMLKGRNIFEISYYANYGKDETIKEESIQYFNEIDIEDLERIIEAKKIFYKDETFVEIKVLEQLLLNRNKDELEKIEDAESQRIGLVKEIDDAIEGGAVEQYWLASIKSPQKKKYEKTHNVFVVKNERNEYVEILIRKDLKKGEINKYIEKKLKPISKKIPMFVYTSMESLKEEKE